MLTLRQIAAIAFLALFASRASGQSIDERILKALVGFHMPSCEKEAADRLINALNEGGAAEDKRFLYYKAVALKAGSNDKAALMMADAAVASGYKPTLIEAKQSAYQWRLDQSPAPAGLSLREVISKRLHEHFAFIQADYPYGENEDGELQMFHTPAGVVFGAFVPKDGSSSALKAASAYQDMNMLDSALRMYSRAVAFEVEDSRTRSMVSMKAWEGMAACYRAQGDWETAEGYYAKAAIGHGLTDLRRQNIKDMSENQQAHRKSDPAKVRPDPVQLEQIIRWCVDARLFADADSGLLELSQLKKDPSIATQLYYHEALVEMIEAMRSGQIKDDVRYRGVDINGPRLTKEKQVVGELRRAMANQ